MLPVDCIREGLYLLGPNRVNIDYKYGQVLVKRGGGAERIEDYLDRNYENMEQNLIQMLLSSCRDLQWVITQLKAGKKINHRPAMRVNLADSSINESRKTGDYGNTDMIRASPPNRGMG